MAFHRSVFQAHTNRQPRTRRGRKPEPGFGPKLIGAVLANGTFVVVDVEDSDWHTAMSAVPPDDIIGEMHRCEPSGKPDPVHDGMWYGTFTLPGHGTHVVEDEFGRRVFTCPATLVTTQLKQRAAEYAEELRILATPAENLARNLACHDWWCHMSDAPGVCGAGEAHMRRIKEIIPDVDVNIVRELWAKHAPEGFTCPV